MPYTLRWEPGGVHRQYLGDVTIVDRRHSFERICADARFDDLRYSITNYLGVSSYEIDELATMEIAALHIGPGATNPNILIAAVVVDPRIIAAITHFQSLRFTALPYRVFDSEAAARAWVSVQPPA